ncbi:MAG: ABC transporter permease [Vallitaleaceae bacterium]|jgi:ribose/xylose/arabinose/galactoside ABC-type transport system permease subunit|nr:ABC transporter permease [Vallitaleaceae bacterium]
MKNILHKRESYLLVVTLVLWGVISIMNPNFASPRFVMSLIGFNGVYFICALGILPLMIKGEIDLSIGGMITATNVIIVLINIKLQLPLILIVAIGLLVGALLGAVSGYIIGRFKLPSVIVTLAMMNIYYGFSKYINRVMVHDDQALPNYNFQDYKIFGFGIDILFIVVMIVSLYYLMHYTSLGRSVYTIGGNKRLAELIGFPYFSTTMKVHLISGLSAGLVAAISSVTFNNVNTTIHSGIEFELLIIVIIGGVSILGGSGSVLGTFLSCLFIIILRNGLVFVRIPVFWHDMIIGVIIILIVSYDMFRHRVNLNDWRP